MEVDSAAEGFLVVIALSLSVVAVFYAGIHSGAAWHFLRRWLRRLGVLSTPPPVPIHRPIERLAQDLRRLRAEVESPDAELTMVRWRGVLAAYDELLVQACAALEIETRLLELPAGLPREAERIRIETRLAEHGLS